MCTGEKEYYEKQFATLKSFEEVDAIVSSEGIDEEDLDEQLQQERAMKISNYANVLLLAFKVINPISFCFKSQCSYHIFIKKSWIPIG